MKAIKARLDIDGKSEPKTRLRGIFEPRGADGHRFYLDTIEFVTEWEEIETGERISLDGAII